MSSRWHHCNTHRSSHARGSPLVELTHLRVALTDNEKSRSLHASESIAGQIRPTTPRDNQTNSLRPFSSGDQCRRGAGARTKHRQWQQGCIALLGQPIRRPGQPPREPGNVEAEFARTQVDVALLARSASPEATSPIRSLEKRPQRADCEGYDGYCHFRGQRAQPRGVPRRGRQDRRRAKPLLLVLELFVRQPCRCSCPQSGPWAS